MTYTAEKPNLTPSSEELRARIPGWGVDLDPKDRPSVPRERYDLAPTGAHWDLPERQPERQRRERSIEHASLTPVFGTACPLRGLSGKLRWFAYRYSEGRALHWLVLIAADRVDAAEHHLRSLLSRRPDNPITETGIRSELTHHGFASRFRRRRADVKHHALDPIIVSAPWVVGGVLLLLLVRRVRAIRRA
jgi:hypothetical protein